MKVVFITSKKATSTEEALKWFQFYCDDMQDLRIYRTLESAKDFLKDVITHQQHIDFIVTDWQFGTKNSKLLLDWIRNSEETYSDSNFMFRKIPVLLIEDSRSQSKSISVGYDSVIVDFPGNQIQFRNAVKNAVKDWRYLLADDLELIGLNPQNQEIIYNHRSTFISYHKLKIISRKFVDLKGKLNYIWTNPNLLVLNQSNETFDTKMRRIIKPKNEEKDIHDFFRDSPTFVKGEDYVRTIEEMLYEKHFYYGNGSRRYDEPDFLNKPQTYSLRNPEIFEVKLQKQRLLTYQHNRLLYNARKSFKQVQRYKSYFTSNDPNHQYYIKLYLGQLYPTYDYSLLMGSQEEKFEHLNLIEKLKNEDFDDIKLITYGELLDKHVRLCNRLDEFNIF